MIRSLQFGCEMLNEQSDSNRIYDVYQRGDFFRKIGNAWSKHEEGEEHESQENDEKHRQEIDPEKVVVFCLASDRVIVQGQVQIWS